MKGRIKVRFWTDSYAPCMIQGRVVNERIHRKLLERARENGFTEEEETFLLSWDNAEQWLHRKAYRDLDNGWPVTVLHDPWEAAHLYGYDAHLAVEDGL